MNTFLYWTRTECVPERFPATRPCQSRVAHTFYPQLPSTAAPCRADIPAAASTHTRAHSVPRVWQRLTQSTSIICPHTRCPRQYQGGIDRRPHWTLFQPLLPFQITVPSPGKARGTTSAHGTPTLPPCRPKELNLGLERSHVHPEDTLTRSISISLHQTWVSGPPDWATHKPSHHHTPGCRAQTRRVSACTHLPSLGDTVIQCCQSPHGDVSLCGEQKLKSGGLGTRARWG